MYLKYLCIAFHDSICQMQNLLVGQVVASGRNVFSIHYIRFETFNQFKISFECEEIKFEKTRMAERLFGQ